MKVRLSLVLLLFFVARGAIAQNAETLTGNGDAAAAADQHAEAIAAYEAAIAKQPALRAALAAKLGRQYLWSGLTDRAVTLLREYVAGHPAECDVRFDYALALSWNDELRAARDEYRNLQQACPARVQQARLREAQIARWQDRQSAASALYRDVLAGGTDENRRDARIGLGFVELEKDFNRGASKVFLSEPPATTATTYEGSALAASRLGDPAAAASIIQRAEEANAVSRELADLRGELQRRDDGAVTPRMTVFHDADGTNFRGADLGASFGWMRKGRATAMFGSSTLERGHQQIGDRWAGASIEHRFAPSFAVTASARRHEFDSIGFQPFTGELDLLVTPTDRTRIDIAAARILISDNVSALEQHLAGTFVSVGIEQRLTYRTRVSVAVDDTFWNTNNERQRIRFNVIHRFEGVPRLTIEWPSLYMRYDEGFAFNLFSPRRYVETGPAVNLYRRFARHWNAAAYLRVGVQQEDALGWKELAIARLSLDRDLHDVWAVGAALSWSNSNLASSTGFRRTSATLMLTRRF